MKGIMILTVLALISSHSSFANGGPKMTDVDYQDGDELKTKESAPDRTKVTREKMQENPRNQTFPESFEQIGNQEKESKAKEK
jgi:hypothetical protein